VVEDCDLRLWARRWGRNLLAFTSGRLVSARAAEAAAVATRSGTGWVRASTRTTALSQNCLCGEGVPKTLAERTHRCFSCGLTGDRDLVAAALAAFVTLSDFHSPGTAWVDYQAARRALARIEGLPSSPVRVKRCSAAPSLDVATGGRRPAPEGAGLLGEVPGLRCRPLRMSPAGNSPAGTTPAHRWRMPDLTSVSSSDKTYGRVLRL
jgi:hypothetical protein